MQLLAGKLCKSRGSERRRARCLQLWLGPPHSPGKLAEKGLQEEEGAAAARC